MYTIKRFKEVGEEVGIKVVEVDEKGTSIDCALCGEAHESGRIERGLYKCPRTGKVINADKTWQQSTTGRAERGACCTHQL